MLAQGRVLLPSPLMSSPPVATQSVRFSVMTLRAPPWLTVAGSLARAKELLTVGMLMVGFGVMGAEESSSVPFAAVSVAVRERGAVTLGGKAAVSASATGPCAASGLAPRVSKETTT